MHFFNESLWLKFREAVTHFVFRNAELNIYSCSLGCGHSDESKYDLNESDCLEVTANLWKQTFQTFLNLPSEGNFQEGLYVAVLNRTKIE